ncbi:MAG: YhbY family RNA-binding protein [archaeon]
MASIGQLQLGKHGITEGFIETLQNHFKNHKNVKVSVLKSCCREKIYLKELAEEMLSRLGKNYASKIIGYTIAIKKLRKEVR